MGSSTWEAINSFSGAEEAAESDHRAAPATRLR